VGEVVIAVVEDIGIVVGEVAVIGDDVVENNSVIVIVVGVVESDSLDTRIENFNNRARITAKNIIMIKERQTMLDQWRVRNFFCLLSPMSFSSYIWLLLDILYCRRSFKLKQKDE
jgi:hypothetical protein